MKEEIFISRIRALKYAKKHKATVTREFKYYKNSKNKLYRFYFYRVIKE